MKKIAYELGFRCALETFSKTARAPANTSVDDLRALRDEYLDELRSEYDPSVAEQRERLMRQFGTGGETVGGVVGSELGRGKGDDDDYYRRRGYETAGQVGGNLLGQYLGSRAADSMVNEETPWKRMTPAQQNRLTREYLDYFRHMEIPTAEEQRHAAMVGGGLLGGAGGGLLGAGIGALAGRPGLGALLGVPTGAAAGVGLGTLRGINEYPSLEEINADLE